jgi:hypothetical protein
MNGRSPIVRQRIPEVHRPTLGPQGRRWDQGVHRVAEVVVSPDVRETIPVPEGQQAGLGNVSIPSVDADIEEPGFLFESIPAEAPNNGDGGSASPMDGGAGGAAGASSCDVPMSMTKVTSGSFHGGFAMGDPLPGPCGPRLLGARA